MKNTLQKIQFFEAKNPLMEYVKNWLLDYSTDSQEFDDFFLDFGAMGCK